MNKYIKLSLFLIAMGAVFFYWEIQKREKTIVNKKEDFSSFTTDGAQPRQMISTDAQMAGLVDPGTFVYWLENYYASHPFRAGDLVYFRYQKDQTPVIRIVRGVSGDTFEVVKDDAGHGWKIKVNNQFLKVGNADLVYGSPDFIPPLGLAAKSHRNRIGDGEVILLTNSASGRFDSLLMGLISIQDIAGKIVLDLKDAP